MCLSHLLPLKLRQVCWFRNFHVDMGKDTGDSGGLGGNYCPLPSLAMQMLPRNGAEIAGLWGLVSKKKDFFLSDAGR